MKRIVVGVDGSPSSVQALEFAVEEAAMRHAELEVLAVVQSASFAPLYGYPPAPAPGPRMDEAERTARAALDEALAKQGRPSPAKASVQVRTGIPAEELLIQAKGADLLVVGSRGAGGLTRMVLGSVSSAVVHHADCPVLIVPAAHP